MTAEEYRALLERNNLRQVDAAWLCGVGERHARSWALGAHPIPQYVSLLLSAYDECLLSPAWLVSKIAKPLPGTEE